MGREKECLCVCERKRERGVGREKECYVCVRESAWGGGGGERKSV